MADTKLQVVIEAQDKASRVFKEFNNHLESTGKKMSAIGRDMSMKLTAPILGMGLVAVKSFADFDQAMTKSTAIMKVTSEQEKEMAKVARDVAKSTAFSHKQAADAYFYLASAGLGANEAMAAMPAVAEFAQAGAFDLALATDLLTDAQSALGLTIRDDAIKNMENMIKVSDTLVKANTLANATVEQFSTALTTEAGAAMKSFSMDLEEGVAVLAAFADQGVKGQVAGSGFSRILRLLTKAANDNKKEMKDLGITVYDSQGNLRNMADIVENLENALRGMSDEQRTVALESIGFTARVQGIILPLLGTSDAIREYEKNLRSAGGITKEVAEKQLQSFTNQMLIVKNIVIDAAIDIGEILIPYIKQLGEKIKELTVKFQKLTPEQKEMVVKVAAITAVIGPLLIVLGAMAGGLRIVSTAIIATINISAALLPYIGAMTKGFINLTKVLYATRISFVASLGPIALIIGAVVLLIKLVKHQIETFDQFGKSLEIIANYLKKGLGEVLKYVSSKIKNLTKDIGILVVALGNAVEDSAITKLGEKIGASIEWGMGKAGIAVENTMSDIGYITDAASNKIQEGMSSAGNFIVEKWQGVSNSVSGNTEDILLGMGATTEEMMAEFEESMKGLEEANTKATEKLSESGKKIQDNFKNYISTVKDFNTGVKNEIEATIGKIAELQQNLVNLEKDYNEKRKDNNMSYAQAYLDQENRIKDTKNEIATTSDTEDRNRLQTKLAEQISTLEQFSSLEKTYHTEIEFLRAEALKSELQRQVEKLKQKEWHEMAEYSKVKEKILAEITAETKKYEDLKALQAKGLEEYAAYLASSEQMTAASIDREIAKYNALAEAVARARQAQASYSGYSFSVQNIVSGLGNTMNDFISRPGSSPVAFSPQDTIIGMKNPAALGAGGITVNINGGTYLSESVAEDIGDKIIDKLKSQIRF